MEKSEYSSYLLHVSNFLKIYLYKDLCNLIFDYLNNYRNIRLLKKIKIFEGMILHNIFDIALHKNNIYIPIFNRTPNNNILEFNLNNNILSEISNTDFIKKSSIQIYNDEIYFSTNNLIKIYDKNFNYKENFKFDYEIEQFVVYKNLIYITFVDLSLIKIFDINKLTNNNIDVNYRSRLDAIFLYNQELYILNVLWGEINIYNIENMQLIRKYLINLHESRHRIFVDEFNIYIIEPCFSNLYIYDKSISEIIELHTPRELHNAFYIDQNLIYLFVNNDLCLYELY